MNKLLLLFLFSFLLCGSVSAMDVAVIHENKAVSGILVEIEDGYETHQYVTDVTGKFSTDLSEGYYWVTIDVEIEEDVGGITYSYADEVYLVDDKLNIVQCEMNESPGFGILVVIGAVAFSVLIIRKRR